MVILRPLDPDDFSALLAWRGGDDYKNAVVASEVAEQLAGRREIFIALIGSEIVGTVQFLPVHPDPELGDGCTVGYLQALEVRPEYQHQGIGRQLIQLVETTALQSGFERITLMVEPDNREALNLYAKLGYAELKQSTDRWRGKEYAVLCLAKPLRHLEGREHAYSAVQDYG